MSAQPTLTKERVVGELTVRLMDRRRLAVRRNAAYARLAQHVLLGTADRPSRADLGVFGGTGMRRSGQCSSDPQAVTADVANFLHLSRFQMLMVAEQGIPLAVEATA